MSEKSFFDWEVPPNLIKKLTRHYNPRGTSTPSTPASPPTPDPLPPGINLGWGPIDSKEFAKALEKKWMEMYMPFEEAGKSIGKIVDEKRAKYGPAINISSSVLSVLWPASIPASDYWKAALFTRMADKMSRIVTDHTNDDEDPWADLVGYSLIGHVQQKGKRNG